MAFLVPTRSGCRVLPALLLVAATVARVLGEQPHPAERADEYPVKAAILYNLAKFIDWPSDAFPDAAAPLTVCVLGADPFGSVLDDALRGRVVGHRHVVVMRVADVVAECRVLFIASSEKKRLPVLTDRLRGLSVLTVSDGEDFIEQGGMIGLTTEGERVRFAINGDAAERARLKVSARLMELALAVRKPVGSPR